MTTKTLEVAAFHVCWMFVLGLCLHKQKHSFTCTFVWTLYIQADLGLLRPVRQLARSFYRRHLVHSQYPPERHWIFSGIPYSGVWFISCIVYGTEQEWLKVMKAKFFGRPSLSLAIFTFSRGPVCKQNIRPKSFFFVSSYLSDPLKMPQSMANHHFFHDLEMILFLFQNLCFHSKRLLYYFLLFGIFGPVEDCRQSCGPH